MNFLTLFLPHHTPHSTLFSLATETKFNLLSFSMHSNPEDAVRDLPLIKQKVNHVCLTLKSICRQIVPVCNIPLSMPPRFLDTPNSVFYIK